MEIFLSFHKTDLKNIQETTYSVCFGVTHFFQVFNCISPLVIIQLTKLFSQVYRPILITQVRYTWVVVPQLFPCYGTQSGVTIMTVSIKRLYLSPNILVIQTPQKSGYKYVHVHQNNSDFIGTHLENQCRKNKKTCLKHGPFLASPHYSPSLAVHN